MGGMVAAGEGSVMMRLRFSSAEQVFEAFPTAHEDIEQVPADVEPLRFIQQLLESATPEDAVGFCAYLLPKREAVWWGCQCIRATTADMAAADKELLKITEAWVSRPEEENRIAALDAGMQASESGPVAWVALAAAWSGGSLTSEPMQPVAPEPYLTAKAVRAAVLTSIAMVPRPERKACLIAAVQAALKLIDTSG